MNDGALEMLTGLYEVVRENLNLTADCLAATSALIEAAENIAGGPLALKVDEANARAREFYDRHGFRPDGEIGIDHGIKWLRMTKFG